MKVFNLSKIERLELIGLCIKAVTGVLGVSVILTENHPYWAITILSLGALADQIVIFIQKKEREAKENEIKDEESKA